MIYMDENGYYQKYNVSRVDGKNVDDHHFFVLDISTDSHAVEAAEYYAQITGNLELLKDLKKLNRHDI